MIHGVDGFEHHERQIFRTLRANREQLLSVYSLYSKTKGHESSVTLDGWLRLFRDAALTTRSLNQMRVEQCFEKTAALNKVGNPVLRFPNFLSGMVHAAHFRCVTSGQATECTFSAAAPNRTSLYEAVRGDR